MKKIAIIGAGISGLTCAQLLKEKNDVIVFEKASEPGGLIRCKRVQGSLFHTCGGHVFNSKCQDVLDWFWSRFEKESEFAKADRNSVVFMENGTEIPYPIENHAYLFDSDIQKKIVDDLVKMAKNETLDPTNFEDFLKCRFGETLYKLYFQPYNEKVWRRDLKSVPLTWLEGKLPMPTVADIIYNNMNHVKEKSFVHSTFWYEKCNGSQFIADRLADGVNVIYNKSIESIEYDITKKTWIINNEAFDKVIFCGNVKDMVTAIRGVDLYDYLDPVDKLEYHGTTAVFCEIDKNPYSWIYQPSKLHLSHRIICTGNFAAGNNADSIPNNRITATIEFTDRIDKDEILKNLKMIPLHPRYLDHKYNKYSYPIQDVNTKELILNLKEKLSPLGFYFTGRFADWEYYNMDVAMSAAMDLCKIYM